MLCHVTWTMADWKQDLMSMVAKLNDAETARDVRFLRSCIYEILTLSTNGCDVAASLPNVVKLLAHSDTFVKRVAGELVAIYAEQKPDLILLATNSLIKDCKDVDPFVRGHGLRVLACLPASSSVDVGLLSSAVAEGLQDSSPYVRTCAALACMSLYQLSPAAVVETGLWDTLYSRLADQDSGTLASCLCVLENIFASEKGIVVSNKLGQFLVTNYASLTPTVQRFVLQFLMKHTPKSKDQVFDHLNQLDASLTKTSSLASTLCSLQLFSYLTMGLPHVTRKVDQSAWTTIKINLMREHEEMLAAVIDYLCATDFPVEIIGQDYVKFFCRDSDSVFLVKQKIRMLCKVIAATPENVETILEELVRTARHLDRGSLSEMVHSVSEVVGSKPDLEGVFVSFLGQLLQLRNVDILDCVLQVLAQLRMSSADHWSILAPHIQDSCRQVSSLSGKIAVLEVIQAYGSLTESTVHILEQMMDDQENSPESGVIDNQFQHRNSHRLKVSLLSAMVKLCLVNPAKIQPQLARLMELYVSDQHRNVRDQALFMYGYLLGRAKCQQKINGQAE